MSTQARSAGGGGRSKASKANSKDNNSNSGINNNNNNVNATPVDTNNVINSKKNNEHVKSSQQEKEKSHIKPTAEQIRIAQITDIKSGMDDPKIREKVTNLMETTQRSEEDVCYALYECDNDLDRAVIFLLESLPVGAFATTSKKKKNRLASVSGNGNGSGTNDVNAGDGEWNNNENNNSSGGGGGGAGAASHQNAGGADGRDKSRGRGGARGGGNRGGGRPRDLRAGGENDRNGGEPWRGRGRITGGRGGYGSSRGGRGGRLGPRGPGRDQIRTPRNADHQEIDSWDSTQVSLTNNNANEHTNKSEDTWGDWDNEEYTGSLTDTKVFTPSTHQNQVSVPTELSAPPGLEQINPPALQQQQQAAEDLVQQYSTTVVSSTATVAAVNSVQYPELHSRQAIDGVLPQINSTSSSLSAEQSQYFKTLSAQNSNLQSTNNVNVNSTYPQSQSVQYATTPYGNNTAYSDQVQQPVRRQRARVPPPSKIPSSAVEMPGDTLNNIGYLDVQFGALDFGTEDAGFEQQGNVTTNLVEAKTDVSDYQTKASGLSKSNLSTGLQSSQNSDNLPASYAQRSSNIVPSSVHTGTQLDQLTKTESYIQANTGSGGGYHNSSYSSTKAPYQQTGVVIPQGYNSYSNAQVSANTNNYQQPPSSYNSYNQPSVNSYQQQNNSTQQNSSSNSTNSVGVGVGGVTTNSVGTNPVVNSNNNSSSNTNTGFLSNQYSGNQTSFNSQTNAYQNNQSVYGNTGLSNNTGYSGSSNSSSNQFSNFNSSKLKDTPVSSSFESGSSSSTVTNSAISTSVSSSTTSNLSISSPSLSVTKVTNSASSKSSGNMSSTAAEPNTGNVGTGANSTTNGANSTSGRSGVVPNLPLVSQYIQPGMQFYQPPVAYAYEDLQMMQQRMSQHVSGYYDINYPTPTSIGANAVRDASVAYSTMSDGRFARTDNNSSPVSNVPSTMPQQSGSGGPMFPYAYAFIGSNVPMPGSFQYGTPAIYQQQMATANASSGGQFPNASYNSGYGSTGYDALSQTGQDYNKNAYPGTGVAQQSKAQSVSSQQSGTSGTDIASSMYGKSHVALNKVNSYDKSYHSATPPPTAFNLAGSQTAGPASAQTYGAKHLFISAMPAHHNMNMHQPMHQMEGRIHNNLSKRDTNSSGQRPQSSSQVKTGTKQGYSPSYWPAGN